MRCIPPGQVPSDRVTGTLAPWDSLKGRLKPFGDFWRQAWNVSVYDVTPWFNLFVLSAFGI